MAKIFVSFISVLIMTLNQPVFILLAEEVNKNTVGPATSKLKATFHLTISMRGQRATGKIQRNNYHHGSCDLLERVKRCRCF